MFQVDVVRRKEGKKPTKFPLEGNRLRGHLAMTPPLFSLFLVIQNITTTTYCNNDNA